MDSPKSSRRAASTSAAARPFLDSSCTRTNGRLCRLPRHAWLPLRAPRTGCSKRRLHDICQQKPNYPVEVSVGLVSGDDHGNPF